MKIEIKARVTGSVLFTHEQEGNTLKVTLEAAVKARAYLGGAYLGGAYLAGANLAGAYLDGAYLGGAYLGGAYLAGANLAGAYLDGAYLGGANLDGANLAGANLAGAYLGGANLDGAYLDGAYLGGANLAGAYLGGANLDGAYLDGAYLGGANLDGANLAGAYLDGDAKLRGARPILQIGPIGSRSAYLVAYLTTKGLYLKTGCFFGARAEFEARLRDEHGDGVHGREYRAALALIDAHAAEWDAPETEQTKDAA